MAPPDGPWSRPPPPLPGRPPPRRWNRGLWLGFVFAAVMLVFALSRAFPGNLDSFDGQGSALQSVLLVSIVAGGLASGRVRGGLALRSLAIWMAIAAALLLGYSFKDQILPLAARLRSEIVPSYAVSTAPGEMMVTRDADGAFYIVGQVEGQAVRFLVDTGSSDIVLSPADARRLGVDVAALTYGDPVETANGVGFGAPYTAGSLRVGPIALSDVPMAINKAPMSHSLLGMAFFNRLQSFRFEGPRLYLKSRGESPPGH